jgi:uncharacterized OsmC-like protein
MTTDNRNDNAFNGVNTQILNTVYNALQNQPEMAKVTFHVKSEWNGGFSVTSTPKGFRVGGQNVERNSEEYKMQYDFPNQLSGQGKGLTVCEYCMGSLAACLAQTIVAHATSRGIQIDGIDIDVEGISSDVRPGAQQFRVNMNIKSTNASKEQINELHEIGKRFSPAFDTLTNGTSVVLVNS